MNTPITLTFVIDGNPTPKARPRFTRQGYAYTDAKTRSAEQAIKAAWLLVAGNRPPHDGEVHVDLSAVFAAPKSWASWQRSYAITGEWKHLVKPDLDNLVKVLDGLNGIAWHDDSQITSISARKTYGLNPELRVAVSLLNHNPERNK